MKYPDWMEKAIKEQQEEDDMGCIDPRATVVMNIVGAVMTGVGVGATVAILHFIFK